MDSAAPHQPLDQPPDLGAGPWRRCLASGEVRAKRDLLRFVVDPDGILVPDPAGRLPGRGLWLSPRRDMLEKACARNLFAKAAKVPVRLPDDLPGRTEGALRRRFLELLGLANRAGLAVAGFQKVRDRLVAGDVALLVHAADAAEDGRRKIEALAGARHPMMPIIALFNAEELGRAVGRESVVHLLVRRGGLAERLETEAKRLAGVVGERGVALKESSLSS